MEKHNSGPKISLSTKNNNCWKKLTVMTAPFHFHYKRSSVVDDLQNNFQDLSANAWEHSNANSSFKVLQCLQGCGRDMQRSFNPAYIFPLMECHGITLNMHETSDLTGRGLASFHIIFLLTIILQTILNKEITPAAMDEF